MNFFYLPTHFFSDVLKTHIFFYLGLSILGQLCTGVLLAHLGKSSVITSLVDNRHNLFCSYLLPLFFIAAHQAGKFKDEMAPIKLKSRKGKSHSLLGMGRYTDSEIHRGTSP